jgi:acetyl esterase/lipase
MASEQFQMVLQMMKAMPKPETEPTVEQMRTQMEQALQMFPTPGGVVREQTTANGVPGEWVTAEGAAADRAILYLHGGGYVVGSINTHRTLAAGISKAAAARVLLIDYRLAPEHPFPAAVEDALAAYRYLLSAGYAPERLAVAGDSAGGGLTVALLVALRDAGEPLPAAAVCLSPWVDLEGLGASMETQSEVDPVLARQGLNRMAAAYLNGADPRTPLAAPLYADLSGLPPLLIQVGAAETLLDDSTRLAERARAVGVDVTLEPWEEMIHVWQIFAPMVPEGQQAIDRIGVYLQERLVTTPAIV